MSSCRHLGVHSVGEQLQAGGHDLHRIDLLRLNVAGHRRLLTAVEPPVASWIGIVKHVPVIELDFPPRLLAVDEVGRSSFELRMRGGYVIAFEECLLCNLPIRVDGNRLPPVVAHFSDRQILEELAHRRNEVIERSGQRNRS